MTSIWLRVQQSSAAGRVEKPASKTSHRMVFRLATTIHSTLLVHDVHRSFTSYATAGAREITAKRKSLRPMAARCLSGSMWESIVAISTDVGILPERLTLDDYNGAELAGGVEALFERRLGSKLWSILPKPTSDSASKLSLE